MNPPTCRDLSCSPVAMAHPCSPLCHLLLLLVAVLLPSSVGGDQREFIYDGFHGSNLTLDGDAFVTADGLLRLTSGELLAKKGHAFHPYPLNFSNNGAASSVPSFSTTFVFSIIGPYLDLSSEGLAFVLSPTKDFAASAMSGPFLGLLNERNYLKATDHLLAIEFDTIKNAKYQDSDNNHVGIDINSLISVESWPASYYDSFDHEYRTVSLTSGEPIQVWVDYDSVTTRLEVTIAPCCSSINKKPSKPLLSTLYDLSSVLTTKTSNSLVFAGFSASTGLVLECKHHILGWSFKVNGEAAAINYAALPLRTIQELANQLQPLQRDSHPNYANSHPNNAKILWAVLVPILAIATVVVFAAAALVKRRRQSKAARKNEMEQWEREYGPPSFSYKDLVAATGGFKDTMLLGRGGFGSVFRGVLPHSKQPVAIKRVSPESKQGMKEFVAEIVILGHLRHRNLVQLLGYCRHKLQLLLVYDYMPNRSLDSYLHTSPTTLLCWAQRFRIIKGVASGLLYLHEEWEQVIIHRDIKSSNVLLDADMNARLGDFGLARSHDHGADAHTTRMAGTWGYIAPELARLGKATRATDVFAFGVLMMEVVCARRPIIWVNDDAAAAADGGEPLALADWVLAAWRAGSVTNAVDPRLLHLEEEEEEEVELVLKLGLLCSHPWPNARPCMRLVMQYLQRDAPLPGGLHPDTLLLMNTDADVLNNCNNDEDEQHALSCPLTTITDLSKGR